MESKMVIGQTDDELRDQIYTHNIQILDGIIARGGVIRGKREIEFLCEMPDEESALSARKLILERLPPSSELHVYVTSTPDVIECNVVDTIEIDARNISAIEIVMQGICRELGGGEVSWGFDSTPLSS